MRWLQTTVQKQEGYLIQVTIGDKGSYAYFSFGAPLAHDDDSIRAVASALDLQHTPPDLDFISDVQIGVSRGLVWAGERGANIRHTYGVMGNEVNMAARLMGKATPGRGPRASTGGRGSQGVPVPPGPGLDHSEGRSRTDPGC